MSTLVTEAGALIASKRVVYIGGLSEVVTHQILRSAFIPFGTIKSLDIPMDYKIGKIRGFGFVEYDDPDDAIECIFNMDCSDLCGKTLKVSLAQQNQLGKLTSSSSCGAGDEGSGKPGHDAIWTSDAWFQQHLFGRENDNNEGLNIRSRKETEQDTETLKE